MLKLISLAFFIAGFLWSVVSQGQSKITGTVNDDAAKSLHNVNVLLKSPDSLLIKGGLTDQNGTYVFQNVAAGKYFIMVSHVGYSVYYTSLFEVEKNQATVEIKTIDLKPLEAQLSQVEVTAKKPLLEQKIDRLVINVANSITSAGNTALEVLERSPGVFVNHQNNTIALNGKDGVRLMINGKISHMPIAAVMQLLNGMNSENIEKIELITTPSANFDAEGNAGYINIVLKENNNYGTNGSYMATLGYIYKGFVYGAGLNINHRQGKVNIYGDLSYSRTRKPFGITAYSRISNKNKITENYFDGDRVDTNVNFNGRIGIDIELSKKTVMGFLFSGYKNNFSQAESNCNFFFINTFKDTTIRLVNSEKNRWGNYSGNFNIQHNYSENEKLTGNLDYIHYSNNQPVLYSASYFDKTDNFVYSEYSRSGKKTGINFLVGSLDYSRKINNNISLDLGVKQTISSFDNEVIYGVFDGSDYVTDNSYSAKYKLREDYSAAYASANIKIDNKTDAKAGLRYEHTNSNLGQEDKPDLVDRHYGNLFPSVFLTHKINENNSVNLSYSMRITRPAFTDLAPFTYFASRYTIITGNPALQPAISNIIKADYSFKKYLLSVSYTKEDHTIAGFQPSVDSVTNKGIVSAANLKYQKTVAVLVSIPVTVTHWWNMQVNATGIWQQIYTNYQGAPIRLNMSNVNVNGYSGFRLPKNYSLELTGFYQSPSLDGLTRLHGYGTLDFGIRKKLDQKSSLVFNVVNIFNSMRYKGYTDLKDQNLVGSIDIHYTQRAFKISYSHTFGKEKLRGNRSRLTGSEDERGRVK